VTRASSELILSKFWEQLCRYKTIRLVGTLSSLWFVFVNLFVNTCRLNTIIFCILHVLKHAFANEPWIAFYRLFVLFRYKIKLFRHVRFWVVLDVDTMTNEAFTFEDSEILTTFEYLINLWIFVIKFYHWCITKNTFKVSMRLLQIVVVRCRMYHDVEPRHTLWLHYRRLVK